MSATLELVEAERWHDGSGQRLALSIDMETLVLTVAMTLSGLLAIGSTRALLGVVLAITRDAAGR